uniref:Uncharacterized protein AlNc14C197G8593 n=1 Tax=Albugo laibachii Nc14 TaxID=890382 RepID=F0WQB2_9STRA|nr:conserved hypothetical protein [Albugo laibachii Nc14]|eukprot:CCA23520.1 conserved hypothetical protein [Albugo laibachii Nc14]
MVATSVSYFSECLGKGQLKATSDSIKCRYKTGKCHNDRAQKRNGQPHQLCRYHRDKANQIQRKFDRQKREMARNRKLEDKNIHYRKSSHPYTIPPSTVFVKQEVEICSDTESSRFSTDSDSSVLEQVWQDIPQSDGVFGEERLLQNAMQSHLSYDELFFLQLAVMD